MEQCSGSQGKAAALAKKSYSNLFFGVDVILACLLGDGLGFWQWLCQAREPR
jgi:hypothetical protein